MDFEEEVTQTDIEAFRPAVPPLDWNDRRGRWAGASDAEIRRTCRSTSTIQTDELPRFEK